MRWLNFSKTVISTFLEVKKSFVSIAMLPGRMHFSISRLVRKVSQDGNIHRHKGGKSEVYLAKIFFLGN